jgi:SSS family solute:Na+ symporter
VLGAKDEQHARVGAIFAGFIKILPVFIFVMPGLICLALIKQGILPDTLDDTAKTYAFLVANILPVGVKGIVVAAMLAALMSTVSGALNSIATVFCYDIYKMLKPEASDRKLVTVGRITTLIAMVLAILWAPQISKFGSILEGNTAMICYIAPSITTVFLGGVMWKRASARGAFITLCAGTVMGFVVFLLDWFNEITGWEYSFMMAIPGLHGYSNWHIASVSTKTNR